MPDGRPSIPWWMLQLTTAKPSKKSPTSLADAENGSPFSFKTWLASGTEGRVACTSRGNPPGIMCGGQPCIWYGACAMPYMAAAAAARRCDSAETVPESQKVCKCGEQR